MRKITIKTKISGSRRRMFALILEYYIKQLNDYKGLAARAALIRKELTELEQWCVTLPEVFNIVEYIAELRVRMESELGWTPVELEFYEE